MKERKNHAPRGALCGLTCAVACTSLALAAPPQSSTLSGDAPGLPMVTTPARGVPPASIARPSGGGEGGIAGASVIYNNGPVDTGEDMSATCAIPGATRSTVQNQPPLCLGVAGFTVSSFGGADDFTLSQCAEINRVTLYAIQAAATTVPTITGGTVTLHSGRPWASSSNVVATSSVVSEPPSLTTIFRASLTTVTPCIRPIQKLVLDTSAWPILPPGTYSISWNVIGNPAGMFSPPVTILGTLSPPGANGQQTTSSVLPATYGPLLDTGSVVPPCAGLPPPGAIQEWPFILEGNFTSGPCPGNTDGNCDVDADDLVNVVLQWGSVCPCTGDVDGDNDVDTDDLVMVVLNWGACVDPPGPIATGACCTGGVCSVVTYAACAAGGGTYLGDGSNCASGCGIPANDDCTGATAVGLGNTQVNTTFATNGGPAPVLCGAGVEISRDVWLALPTINATQYTVTTTGTPSGPGNVADTVLIGYSGTCAALTEVACNDDIGIGGGPSTIVFTGDGNIMLIRVGTWVAAQPTVAPGGNIVVGITSP